MVGIEEDEKYEPIPLIVRSPVLVGWVEVTKPNTIKNNEQLQSSIYFINIHKDLNP